MSRRARVRVVAGGALSILLLACCASDDLEPPRCGDGVCSPGERAAGCGDCIDGPWVRVDDRGRYFVFEDGRPFFPLGMAINGDHINYEAFGTVRIGGSDFTYRTDYFDSLFAEMRANGENLLRIDIEGLGLFPVVDTRRLMAGGKIQLLEDPVGVLNERYARRIDRLVSLAEQHGIYLDLVLFAHSCDITIYDEDGARFRLHPYHRANGGPLESIDDLLRSPEARAAYRRRLEAISDRWGGSPSIFVWELYNELLNCGGTDAQAAADWTAEMGRHLREHETARHGRAHLIAVSTSEIVPDHELFFESPGTDVMVSHFYGPLAREARHNPVLLAKTLHAALARNLEHVGYRRPYIENERTLSWFLPRDHQAAMEKAAMWSEVASGAASGGSTWIRLGEHGRPRHPDILRPAHGAVRGALERLDLATFDSRPLPARTDDAGVLVMAVGDGVQAIGWLLHDNPDDTFIDLIRRWRAGDEEIEPFNPLLLLEWVRILEEAGVETGFEAFLEDLSDRLAAELDIEARLVRDALDRLVAGGLADRPDVASFDPALVAIAREAFAELASSFEAIEAERGVLAARYRGHPEVSTTLRFTSAEGAHELVWIDDESGEVRATTRVEGPAVSVASPAFRRSLAFVLVPARD